MTGTVISESGWVEDRDPSVTVDMTPIAETFPHGMVFTEGGNGQTRVSLCFQKPSGLVKNIHKVSTGLPTVPLDLKIRAAIFLLLLLKQAVAVPTLKDSGVVAIAHIALNYL